MSTIYGRVKLRDGRELEVEAFGVSRCVKLVLPGYTRQNEIAIDDENELQSLMTLLEIAREHVWKQD